MPGTALGSGDMRMRRCNLCFHCAYSLKVETDIQTNLQYNTVKCFRGGIDKVQWEFGRGEKEHLPGETRNSFTEEGAVTWPVLRNWPCRQAGKGNDRCKDTEAQGALQRSRWCGFSWAEGAVGTVAGWARQVGGHQIVKRLLIIRPFIQHALIECSLCAKH